MQHWTSKTISEPSQLNVFIFKGCGGHGVVSQNIDHNQDLVHMQLFSKYWTLSNLGVPSCSNIVTYALFLSLSPFPAIVKDKTLQNKLCLVLDSHSFTIQSHMRYVTIRSNYKILSCSVFEGKRNYAAKAKAKGLLIIMHTL